MFFVFILFYINWNRSGLQSVILLVFFVVFLFLIHIFWIILDTFKKYIFPIHFHTYYLHSIDANKK